MSSARLFISNTTVRRLCFGLTEQKASYNPAVLQACGLFFVDSLQWKLCVFLSSIALCVSCCRTCNTHMVIQLSAESSFQMTVESNYAIAIATRSDWLKNLAPVFQPMRSETNTNCSLYARFFPRFEQVTGNCSEFWLVHRAVCSCFDWSKWLL